MFLIVIGVLSLVLAFPSPPYRWLSDPGYVMLAVAAATLLPPLVAVLVGRRAVVLLDAHPDHPGRGQYAFGRGMMVTQFLLAVCHATLFLLTDWVPFCGRTPVVGGWPLVSGLLAIVPFLVSILLAWIAVYPADRAVRHIALETHLFRGRPIQPVWPLPKYLLFNLRHQVLFVLIPMVLILAARDVIGLYQRQIDARWPNAHVSDLLLGTAAALVAIIAPLILRHVWVTQRLPDGPLRDRLTSLCRKLRLRCREILVWRSGGMIVNAAVMGLIAPLRYVLITDAMVEQLPDTKIEAVFGHEAGHVKRHHILFFLLFAFISGCLVTILSARARHLDRLTYQLLTVAGAGVLVFKWGVLFGWISRRFERQADVFGVRTLALGGLPCDMPCALHHPTDDNPADSESPATLCSTAAHVFGDTLNDVALLNGIPPGARSWRHSSISSRSRFVQKLAHDPAAARRFERTLYRVKLAILLTAAASGLWAACELQIWRVLG